MGERTTDILLIDQSGRGHALCDLFVRTNERAVVHYGPGSNMIDHPRILQAPSIHIERVESVLEFCRRTPVDLIFVTRMDSLSRGFVDTLRAAGHNVVGPSRAGAALEDSKRRGKQFCEAHGIAMPAYRVCTDPCEAHDHIEAVDYDVVVKEDGVLDCSDGVHVCSSRAEAHEAVDAIARKGGPFVVTIEERLVGTEVSITAFTDGVNYCMLPLSLDYKRTLDGDGGKNCDGMGTISPHPLASDELYRFIENDIMTPFMAGLRAEGIPYSGFVYLGGMITATGLKILEINARLGDSEAQAILPALHEDFAEMCLRAVRGALPSGCIQGDGLYRCCVVATQGCIDVSRQDIAPGWPFGACDYGQEATGFELVDPRKALIFFDGVQKDGDGVARTCRGRVVNIVGYGKSGAEAVSNAYGEMGKIEFNGARYRTDIGDIYLSPLSV